MKVSIDRVPASGPSAGSGHRPTKCPLCGKVVQNLPRHMRSNVHKIANPLTLVSHDPLHGRKKPGDKKDKRTCVVCDRGFRRISQHIRTMHHLNGEILKETVKSCALTNFVDILSTVSVVGCVKPNEPFELGDTPRCELNCEVIASDILDSVDVTPCTSSETVQPVEIHFNVPPQPLLPLLDEFETHLGSLAGGNKTNTHECRQHVSKIIHAVGNNIQSLSVDNVHNCYFAQLFNSSKGVTDGYGNTIRNPKPTSVNTYLYSFKLFLNFLQKLHPSLLLDAKFQRWFSTLPEWFATLKREIHRWQADKEGEKVEKMVTPEAYVSYLKSTYVADLESQMRMCTDEVPAIFSCSRDIMKSKFIAFRNHLIVRIFTENANRPCVLENLTKQLLSSTKQANGIKGYSVLISRHKTAYKYLSAALSFDEETGPLVSGFVNLWSLLIAGKTSGLNDYLFCTVSGKRLSTSHINQILTTAYKSAGFPHVVSTNKLRYMATTNMALKAPENRVLLAKSMCHSMEAADRNYTILSRVQASQSSLQNLKTVYGVSTDTTVDNCCMEATSPVIVSTSSLSHALTTDSPVHAVRTDLDGARPVDGIKYTSDSDSNDNCDAETADNVSSSRTRVTWSTNHSNKIKMLFASFISKQKLPTLSQIRKTMQLNSTVTDELAKTRMVDLSVKQEFTKFIYAIRNRIKLAIERD